MICVSASAFGEGGSGRPAGAGAAVAVRVAGHVWARGCRRRRGRGGCRGGPVVSRARGAAGAGAGAGAGPGSLCSVLAALVFSSRPSRCVHHPECVCVLGGSLGTRGSLSHLPRRRHCLWLPPRRRLRSPGEVGGSGVPAGPAAATPGSRGRGCRSPLGSLLFGAPRLPLSPTSRPSVRLGVGTSPRRPPPASHGNLRVGVRPLPRGVELGELRGCWGLLPRCRSASPSPGPTRPPSARESGRERERSGEGPGPRRLGHPQLPAEAGAGGLRKAGRERVRAAGG